MRNLTAWTTTVLFAAAAFCLYGQTQAAQEAPKAALQPTKAEGIPPRSGPTDYQTHTKVGDLTIAADFAGHSVPTPEATLSTDDYLVMETAFFGPPEAKVKLSIDDFTLRINGKKKPLASQPSEVVFKSLKDPEWAPPEQKEKKSKTSFGGGGDTDTSSVQLPPKVPLELRRTMSQRVEKASLPQGDRTLPQAGLIFFDYHGKVASIHSIELVYKGPAGEATLTLTP
ncbi:MAG: hypothetical protein ACJ746_25875 [Bryobacteraceae bacterium]